MIVQALFKTVNWITTFVSGKLMGWLVFAMMALVLVDVTSRYVLNNPLSIAEEYGGYLLVAVTCMGLAFAWQERSHVRVEFVLVKLPPVLRGWLRVFTVGLAFVFSIFMVLASYELVEFSFMFGTRSGSWLRTPIAYPQMVLIAGSVLLFLQLIVELANTLKRAVEGKGEEA